MNKEQVKQVIKAHLKKGETECRWCFAIDMHKVKADIIAKYDFPDTMILHLKCPRCGGEFSYYIREWGEPYLKSIITKLHPELEGKVDDDLLGQINDRMWSEYEDC